MRYFRVHTADLAYITQQPRGLFTAVGRLVDAKTLTGEETQEYWRNRAYFEEVLPVPPFYEQGNPDRAVTWFKDTEAGNRIWRGMTFYRRMAEKYGLPLFLSECTEVPGEVIYEDDFQVAVKNPREDIIVLRRRVEGDAVAEREIAVFYRDGDLTIRNMEPADAQAFTDGEKAQGWHADIAKYHMRLRHQAEGKCVSLTAVWQGHPAGYINIYRTAPREGNPFAGTDWPEIVDFGVLRKDQRHGIGARLMDAAERVAGAWADTVCLGVGLPDSYGSAQRMYVKRGYIPDGSGVWYQGKPCVQYETVCTVDDDMILFLSKKLSDG